MDVISALESAQGGTAIEPLPPALPGPVRAGLVVVDTLVLAQWVTTVQ